MKYPVFVANISVLVLAFLWCGCSSSTPPAGITLTRTISIPMSIDLGNARLEVCGDTLLGTPRDTTLPMVNTGNDTLRIRSVSSQSQLFSVISDDSVIPPAGTGPLHLRFCPSQNGMSSATIVVASNATQDSSLTLTVNGNGVPYTPGVGSTFIYNAVKIDTTGKPIPPTYLDTQSIVVTGLTYQGKTNVSETADSTYFEVETNGDVSIYTAGFPTYPSTNLVGNGWLTLPFGSQARNQLLISNDQSFNDSLGQLITMNVRDSASYVGTTMVTIGGNQYHSSHVHI